MLPVRVSKTSELLETYMVVNFRAREINRGARKLARTPILIKKKNLPVTELIEL